MKISVVIPTHNRKETLRRCLAAVTAQEYPDYEVIVVDDGSSDGTGVMVQRDFPQVRLLRQKGNQGPAAARNLGIRQSTGAIVAFTDDDCVPPPEWLQRHTRHYTGPRIGAVGGHQVAAKPNFYDKFDMARYADEYRCLRLVEKLAAPGGLYSNNLSVPKTVLDRVGLFDERFLTGADPELTRRISRAGYTLIHDPDIRVEHLKVHTFRSYCRMRFRRGCGVILTDLKEGTLSPKRFIPLPNPVRTWQDWSHFRAMFGGNALDSIAFWGLALVARLVEVAGRFYYYLTAGRHSRWDNHTSVEKTTETRSDSSGRHLWQVAPSPVKLRYLAQYATGKTALDVGSGAGFYARALAERGFRVTAVDFDPALPSSVPLAQARLSALPFAGPFDTVVCFDVLEHEEDEERALHELRRLVAGRLILSVPNADDRLLLPYNLTYKHHVDKTHRREYTLHELKAKLVAAGFRIVHGQREGPVHPAVLAELIRPRWLGWPARFLLKVLYRLRLLYNEELMADVYVVAEPDR